MRALAPLDGDGAAMSYGDYRALMEAPLEDVIVYWGIVQVNGVYAKSAHARAAKK